MQAIGMQGLMLALAAPSLYAWGWVSVRQPDTDMGRRYAWTLLALAAVIARGAALARLGCVATLSQRLDAHALATLAGLHARDCALPPWQQALLFALSVPAERVLQRLAGLFLQLLTPGGAHA